MSKQKQITFFVILLLIGLVLYESVYENYIKIEIDTSFTKYTVPRFSAGEFIVGKFTISKPCTGFKIQISADYKFENLILEDGMLFSDELTEFKYGFYVPNETGKYYLRIGIYAKGILSDFEWGPPEPFISNKITVKPTD